MHRTLSAQLGGATVKIGPPFTISAEAVLDGARALEEAIVEGKEAR